MIARSLSRAAAAVLWADNKVSPSEINCAKTIFNKYGIPWSDAHPILEEELERLLDVGDEDEGESDHEIDFGVIDFGDHADVFDIMTSLCNLACANKCLTLSEIDILHRLGESMNLKKELVSAALVSSAIAGRYKIVLE